MLAEKVSIVLPIRNREDEIADRIAALVETLSEVLEQPAEIVIVDDGSLDATADTCKMLAHRYENVRIVRHERPRGMEAAGQTGLERATGDVVFIQERDENLSLADLLHLMRLTHDTSIVAARAESTRENVSASLVRRMRLWGMPRDGRIGDPERRANQCGLQMVRRTNLQRLLGPNGRRYRLEGRSRRITSLQRPSRSGKKSVAENRGSR